MNRRFKTALLITIFLAFFINNAAYSSEKKFGVGDKVKVYWIDRWHACTVIEVGEGKYKIHFEDDDRIFDRWMKAEKVKNFTYSVGDIILVKKGGKWLPGKVIAAGTTEYKIHYVGMESSFDEWVGPGKIKEIKYEIGQRVMVFWHGDWFEAEILNYDDGKYKVHFKGFPSSCDEWVTIDRMKKL